MCIGAMHIIHLDKQDYCDTLAVSLICSTSYHFIKLVLFMYMQSAALRRGHPLQLLKVISTRKWNFKKKRKEKKMEHGN